MRIRLLLLWLCALVPGLRATSVIPPDFSELVTEADAIYRGRVTDIEARRVARGTGSVIKTFVTVAIERTLKGAEQPAVTLEFLGGTLGDESLEVSGMPTFAVGERGIVFVQKNGRQFCPLVRLGHGSYRIEHDASAARDYVARANHAPLNDVAEVAQPLSERGAPSTAHDVSRALSPAAFEASIVTEMRKATPTARPN